MSTQAALKAPAVLIAARALSVTRGFAAVARPVAKLAAVEAAHVGIAAVAVAFAVAAGADGLNDDALLLEAGAVEAADRVFGIALVIKVNEGIAGLNGKRDTK